MRCSKFTTPSPKMRWSPGGSWPFSRCRGVMIYSTTSPSKSVGSGDSGRGAVGAEEASPASMGAPAGAEEEEEAAALDDDDDRLTVPRRGWRGHRGGGRQLRLRLGRAVMNQKISRSADLISKHVCISVRQSRHPFYMCTTRCHPRTSTRTSRQRLPTASQAGPPARPGAWTGGAFSSPWPRLSVSDVGDCVHVNRGKCVLCPSIDPLAISIGPSAHTLRAASVHRRDGSEISSELYERGSVPLR